MDVGENVATSQYIALGFKEPYAAYRELSQAGTQLPSYWGMNTSIENKTDLGGRILLGYPTSSGKGCFRKMRATAFVAEIEDVPDKDDDGTITNGKVTHENGRTRLEFTAKKIHVASDAESLSWYGSGGWPRAFGFQRVMWASGAVDTSAQGSGCVADELHYHFGNRMVAGLNFPNMVREREGEDEETEETKNHTDPTQPHFNTQGHAC